MSPLLGQNTQILPNLYILGFPCHPITDRVEISLVYSHGLDAAYLLTKYDESSTVTEI